MQTLTDPSAGYRRIAEVTGMLGASGQNAGTEREAAMRMAYRLGIMRRGLLDIVQEGRREDVLGVLAICGRIVSAFGEGTAEQWMGLYNIGLKGIPRDILQRPGGIEAVAGYMRARRVGGDW